MPSTLLVRCVFGLLVIATIGAFFVTQRLKTDPPEVRFLRSPKYVSPNGDRVKERTRVGFVLPEHADITFSVVEEDGDEVRRIVEDRRFGRGRHRFTWDGRTDEGGRAPDGVYQLQVSLRDEGRTLRSERRVILDTTPPRPRLRSAVPATIAPRERGVPTSVRVRYRGPRNRAPEFRVYRTDLPRPVELSRFQGDRTRSGTWDGRGSSGPAPDGVYAFSVTVRDRAGNLGSAPRRLPPSPRGARRGTGVSVRYLTARGPLEPVTPGSSVRIETGPGSSRSRWRLVRLGREGALSGGRGIGPAIRIRVPRRARTGLHVVRVRARGRLALVPLAVAVDRPPRRPLVVLPAITWQGLNQVDDDADGFPETLDGSPSVGLARPFAHGRLPPALRDAAELLGFVDRRDLSYDLTTDVALARGHGPVLGRRALVFPGDVRWLTQELDVRLREHVEAGAGTASFGTDSFRRRVRLEPARLTDPSPPERRNVFGESTRPLEIQPAPMVVNEDRLGFFRGGDGFIGLFSRFEESTGLVQGSRVLTRAGRELERPAFVAYRLGRGLVVRAGTPDWTGSLAEPREDAETARATERVWELLSR